MLQTQPFEVSDWTGGLSEERAADKNQYLQADNLFLNTSGHWQTRYGSTFFDAAAARLGSASRVGTFINFNDSEVLFAHSLARLYYYDSNAWNEIVRPDTAAALVGNGSSDRLTYSEWKKHTYIASSAQLPITKVYKDGSSNTWKAVTAGLPQYNGTTWAVASESSALNSAIILCNRLRVQMLGHFALATSGGDPVHKTADTVAAALITSGAAGSQSEMITLTGQLLKAFDTHQKDAANVSKYHYPWQDSQWGNSTLATMTLDSVSPPTTLLEACVRLNDLRIRWNAHEGNAYLHNLYSFGTYSVVVADADFIVGTNGVRVKQLGPGADFNWGYIQSALRDIPTPWAGHRADTDAHSSADTTNTIADLSTPNADNASTLLNRTRIAFYGHHGHAAYHPGAIDAANTLTKRLLTAEEGFTAPDNYSADSWKGAVPGDISSFVSLYNELISKMKGHMLDMTAHFATDPTYVEIFGGAIRAAYPYLVSNAVLSTASYNYAFTYSHTYTIGSTTFLVESKPFYFGVEEVLSIDVTPLTIEGIISLAAASNCSYDTSNVKMNIYRTINGGSDYFLVDQVACTGISSYTDRCTDSQLQTSNAAYDTDAGLFVQGKPLYTAGGVLPNTQPPSAKYLHIANNIGYLGNLVGNPNRIQVSLPNTIEGCPGNLYVDLPLEVKGISSNNGIVVAWTRAAHYRLEGQFDLLGQGSITAVEIASKIGLSASASLVQTEDGILFASADGFYITDGYKTIKINRKWPATYANLISTTTRQGLIHGAYDSAAKFVWWGVCDSGTENNKCYLLNLNYPLTENSIFSTASNGSNFVPTALGYFNGEIIRGDASGYVYVHRSSVKSDLKLSVGTTPANWNIVHVPYTLTSPAFDFGTTQGRKWIPSIETRCDDTGTNLSLQINSINDGGRVTASLAPIRFRDSGQEIFEIRKMPAGSIRCSTKQIVFTNARVVITNSDTLGLATLDSLANTLTLLSGSWPSNYSDHVIALANDGYVAEWTIASQSGGVLTLTDAGNTLPANGNYKWVVRGYPKDELLELVSYCLNVAALGPSKTSADGESGANA